MFGAHTAQSARNHYRLVIPTVVFAGIGICHFKGSKVTAQRRPAKFVVEARGSDWALKHDLQRAGDLLRFTNSGFPGLRITRDIQVRRCKPGQTRLGF